VKLPLSWLGEFVTLEADGEELCRRLTVAGLEVEAVEHLKPAFLDVYTAEVRAVERHPNADRLSVCDVDAGVAGRYRVVCGAPNVRAGMKAALARVGARLAAGAHGSGSGRIEEAPPLEAAVIRGVRSEGMLCSELELALSKDHEGILELPADTPPGVALSEVLGLPDTVLDIAITPNRGDCLSVYGLAREVAALFDAPLRQPHFLELEAAPAGSERDRVRVRIEAPELCPRYAALPMSGISIRPSPIWLRRRLELCGMRGLNNVVDITNYVMLELGQPLHAFDASQIREREIVVRRAERDSAFTTLDGVERRLNASDLVIADRERVLAIAGVMGGRNSEVSETTTAIILESAYFEPASIARTARRLGLRSESSYRFERGIDRAGQANALRRAAELVQQLAGGRVAAPLVDLEPRPAAERRITVDLGGVAAALGTRLPDEEIKRRLRAVGVTVTLLDPNRIEAVPPSFRPDLNETADLVEEVARLKGLSEIPAELPVRRAGVLPPNRDRALARKLRDLLTGCGLVEARTLAFVAPEDNRHFPSLQASRPLVVTNPLSSELSEMRASLLPGLLGALRFNLNREASAVHLFEIGKVFGEMDEGARESARVAGVSFGDYAYGGIGQAPIKSGFFTVKGILEACLSALLPQGAVSYEPIESPQAPYLHPGRAATIKCGGELIGLVGELHPAEALRLEISAPCSLFELDVTLLAVHSSKLYHTIVPPPRFPAVRRDVALVVNKTLAAGEVLKAFWTGNAPMLESVELFDVFEGGNLGDEKKSVAVACRYRSADRTLTDEEVNRTHTGLVDQVARKLGASLRS